MKKANLRVARIETATQALGPGCRAVVWFHGCSKSCPGCIAREMNQSSDFELWTGKGLADFLLGLPNIEGVTLSGGEPFEQDLEELRELLEILRKSGELSVVCYTGNTLEELETKLDVPLLKSITSNVDLLIDGNYVEELNDGSVWRGSSNQRFHFLSSRYNHLKEFVDSLKDRKIEVVLDSNSVMRITGIPPADFMRKLNASLKERGLEIEM